MCGEYLFHKRAVHVSPDTFTILELRARVDFDSKGDLLASWPETPDPNGTIILTHHNYEAYTQNFAPLLGILQRSEALTSRGETSAPIPKSFLRGNVYAFMKDEKAVRSDVGCIAQPAALSANARETWRGTD